MSVLKRPLSLLGKMNTLMNSDGNKAATDDTPSQPRHVSSDHMTDQHIREGVSHNGGKGAEGEEIVVDPEDTIISKETESVTEVQRLALHVYNA